MEFILHYKETELRNFDLWVSIAIERQTKLPWPGHGLRGGQTKLPRPGHGLRGGQTKLPYLTN